ncbi:CPBP family intramembrane metalloprotease [Sphingomonas sp. SUN019]|uniref:CPBP family intramembrane glutamic endopeptidase n=1 Tax=Sphingomonas sp. SUN019 TaxID=2937788 RepID=UPI0021645001|nr:type II CAAX endopeptidase family protein [Sphingomonas sp. SUN019]UVO50776.1 CPBP family intramembrane metalloprotease [Sphingomonas sp. SUN019]
MIARAERRRLIPLAIIGLILAFGLPELGLAKLFPDPRVGREIVWIAFGVLILLWVTKVERLPLTSIGLRRPTWGTFGWGLAATVVLMATVMLTFALIVPALGLEQNIATTGAIVQVPLWLLVATPIVAGVTEELVYRGYAIERLELLTGRPWLAGLIGGIMFVLVHWSWGSAQLILVAFATAILVPLYLWRRDLPCVMIAHILTDLIGFALARAQM